MLPAPGRLRPALTWVPLALLALAAAQPARGDALPARARPVADAAGAIPDPEVRARFLVAAARYLARFAPGQPSGAPGSGTA